MIHGNRVGRVSVTLLLAGAFAAALSMDEVARRGVEVELAPRTDGGRALEETIQERTPPWLQRWLRMMDGRQDELGRDPAEALRQAREYDRTMPVGAGPGASIRAGAQYQTVPGDAWRSLGPESISGDYMDVSGRVRGLVVVNDNLIYIGAADGGVWKWKRDPIEQTATWTPLSDFEDTLAIGALAIDPQDPQILYAGTGEVGNYFGVGILKSTDGGQSWTTKGRTEFTGKRISTVALDPRSVSDPASQRILWVASTVGLYRSTDGGDTWTSRIPGNFTDVVLDPIVPDLVFAGQHGVGIWKLDMSAAGIPQPIVDIGGQLPTQRFGRIRLAVAKDPQGGFPFLYASMEDKSLGAELKGIWRSNDRGTNWTRVTGHPRQFADGVWANANRVESESNDTVGTADVVPVNMSVQGTISSSSDVDVFRFTLVGRDSFNAEILAERAGSGLHPRLSLLDAAGNPVMRRGKPYWKNGELRNTAGQKTHDSRMGTGWELIPPGTYHLKVESDDGSTGQYQLSILGIDLWCQCGYDQALTVDPGDPDVIYMGLISFFRTTNGGADWTEIQDHAKKNWVHQDIQIVTLHPTDSNTVFVGSDGGVWRSPDRGDTWTSMNTDGLVITQPAKASIHPTDPGFIIIGNQDNASSKLEAGVWTQLGSGDGATNAIVSASEYYYSAQGGAITKVDPVRGVDNNMGDNGFDRAGSAFHTPFAMDPNNSQVLLAGGGEKINDQVFFRVYRTTDGAQNWNSEGSAFPTHVMALAFAPSDSSIYYVGTNRVNPEIWRVTGTGTVWNEITWPNIPDRTITDIEVAPTDSSRVFVTFKGFGGGTVFRTTDAGQNWEDIGRAPHGNANLPPGISQTPLPDVPVEAIVVDPTYVNTLWVGTDLGVYRTLDGGVNWHKFGYLLPNAGIRDLVLSRTSGGTGRLLAVTYGRGVWELYVGNDSCSDASVITDGNLAGTTRGSTPDGASSCFGDSSGPSVWYEYKATCDGELSVDTCGSNFDTLVSIHGTGCPGSPLTELTCNDDCSSGCSQGAACAVAQVTQGSTYMIRVTGYDGTSGNFLMNVRCEAPNDTCETALPIAVGQTASGSTRGALSDAAPVCKGVDQTAAGVWYTTQGTGNWITASTCGGTDYDTKLSVYCSGCVGRKCIEANDDASCGTDAEVTWCSAPGVTYDLLVHGYQQQEGSFDLQITQGAYCGPVYIACSPGNDQCDYAQSLNTVATSGDNTDATTGPAPSCRATSGDVWYDFEPRCHGFATVDTCSSSGSLVDTVLAVYDACGGRERGCNDDACGVYSSIVLPMRPGGGMRIQVADYFGDGAADEGTFTVDVDPSLTLLTTPWPGLYAADGAGPLENHLLLIDRDLRTASDVGALGQVGIAGLAWASGLGLMYGVDDAIDNDDVVVIDPDTGVATVVGPSGFTQLRGLAWDANRMTLYSTDTWTGTLVGIDPFTGAGTMIGTIGFAQVEGLAFDPASDKLYGSDVVTDQLIEIDPMTGAGTAIGPFGGAFGEIRGLAFDTVRGELLGSQVDGNDGRLVRIDRVTGAAMPITDVLVLAKPQGLTYVEGLPDATVGQTYEAQLPVSGGCPRYTFGEINGEPPGLTLDRNGKFTGTPTANGAYTITYFVGDSDLSSATVSASFPVVVRPANDRCSNAETVGLGAHGYSTVRASTDGPDEVGVCDFFGSTQVDSDIWYRWVATCTGNLLIDTCGSTYDTKLAVYEGPNCPLSPSAAACNDDASCSPGSEIAMPVQAGQTYTIRVGGFNGAQGNGTMSLQCVGAPAGGCCTGSSCELRTEEECVNLGGTYLGDSSSCAADADGDGLSDGCDACPSDANKFAAGICGCGVLDFDTDGDGEPDCIDTDIDGDGVTDADDVDPFDRFRCWDLDGDGCDDCFGGTNDPANDGADTDGDGWCDAGDCTVTDGSSYRLPGEPLDLRFDPTGLLTWTPPAIPGGSLVLYDVLRAPAPSGFPAAECVESDDIDSSSSGGSDPAPGGVWYFLVRAGNSCGDGSLGVDYPGGVERSGRTCP